MACTTPLGTAVPDLLRSPHIRPAPDLRAQRILGTADRSLLVGGPLGGLPVRAGNTICPSGTCLNRAHSFWTYRTVTFMASAMIWFLVPFLFSAAMYSTLDWSSFFITRTLRVPI